MTAWAAGADDARGYTPRAGPMVLFQDSCISDSNRPHVCDPSWLNLVRTVGADLEVRVAEVVG